jgi:hypothetical protein
VIRTISADTYGRIQALEATFEQHCNSIAPALRGTIKFQAEPAAPISLTSSNPSVLRYQPVTFTASLPAGSSGAVTFFDGPVPLETVAVGPEGIANHTTSLATAGPHTISAAYDGTVSAPLTQMVRDNTKSLWFESGAGHFVAQGATASFNDVDDGLRIFGTTSQVDVQGSDVSITIRPPSGETLHTGSYLDTLRSAEIGHAQLDIGGYARGCNKAYGAFDISEIATDALGKITVFNATFTHRCESTDGPPMLGTIHLNGNTGPNPTTTTSTTTRPRAPGQLQASPSQVQFGEQRVGTYGDFEVIEFTNVGDLPVEVTDLYVDGGHVNDFGGTTDCFDVSTLAPFESCRANVLFAPTGLGARATTLRVEADGQTLQISLRGAGTTGYYLAGSRGEVGEFGDAEYYGDATDIPLKAPIISLATTPNGAGYWLLGRDGGIFSFGNARFYGSTGGMRLNKPVVGMAATPTGRGYWLVASDGGIFAYGDARFYGSTGSIRLAQPIISMSRTPSGRGYRFVASDGGVFNFGDARYYGSAAGSGARIVGLASTPTGRGYWMVSNAGRVFSYGDAPQYGDVRSLGVTNVIGINGTSPLRPSGFFGR